MTAEEWRAIPGYEGHYEISDLGHVRSVDRVTADRNGRPYSRKGSEIALRLNYKGYSIADLNLSGTRKTYKVHALVALAFLGPRPDGMYVCHNDGIKSNNTPSNLRYDTPAENARDTVRHGANHLANLTHCKRGHAFTEANTKRDAGGRKCRTCVAANERARVKRAKATAP